MWEYIFLGALQGIFEWIPISSEGVLTLFSSLLVSDINSIDFSLFLHLGTMLAIIIYFRKEWVDLFSMKDKKLFRFFIIASSVSLALGFILYKTMGNINIGSGLLFLMGVGLLLTSFFQKKNIKLKISDDLSSFLVGLLQGIAVIPGVSRSGSTIFGLSLKESDPSEILKKSYLISLPAVAASSGYIFINNPSMSSFPWLALVSSFIFGIISLKVILDFSKKTNFSTLTLVFGLLCLAGGLIEFLIL